MRPGGADSSSFILKHRPITGRSLQWWTNIVATCRELVNDDPRDQEAYSIYSCRFRLGIQGLAKTAYFLLPYNRSLPATQSLYPSIKSVISRDYKAAIVRCFYIPSPHVHPLRSSTPLEPSFTDFVAYPDFFRSTISHEISHQSSLL